MSLVDTVKQAGVIGCGGAGFPAHVKIDTKADVVIANGAECEPLLNSDQRVMEHYADELIEGLALIMRQVGAARGIIGLKEAYHGSIDALSSRIADVDGVELGVLGNFYPSGDEQILLTELTGRIVPEGGIPPHVNAVVSNVLTIVQVARASRGRNVTHREVTLVGEVRKPKVAVTAIGTPIRDLLKGALPAIPLEDMVVIDGGPMMGKVVPLDATVNKTTSGLVFLSRDHPLIQWRNIPMSAMVRRSAAACCQCRDCTEACSRYMQGHDIQPHLMMRSLAYQVDEPTKGMTAAFLCSQCGLCEFACPMDLSPRRAYAELAAKFKAGGMKNPHHNAPASVHEFNQYRKIGKDRLIRRYQLTAYDSHDLTLTPIPDPPMVRLSLTQAFGAPSEPVVKTGDSVKCGQLIAKAPDGKLGANLHASIDGQVTGVDCDYITITIESPK
ncbi:MAG: 4Fe-4S dicluster domain-containing protein [Planctomycetes bacterium]|nr:4Fe-4S dicluster domain-containing protein [Planctomycetota bacterium]